MRFRLALAAAFAAAVVAHPSLAAQPGSAEPDTVRLRFGWTPGASARVSWERLQIRGTTAGADTSRIAYSYTLSVEEHPEGLRLMTTDADWAELPGEGDAVTRAMFKALAEMGSTGTPGTVVSPAGTFLRLDGVGEFRERLVAAMSAALEGVDGGQDASALMSTALTEDALTGSAAGDWLTLVGFWIDTDLEMESRSEVQGEVESPFAPGTRIPTTTVFGAEAAVPCAERGAGADRRCVRLVAESVPDPDAMAQVTRELMVRMGIPAEELDSFPLEFSTTVVSTLVTEEATLRPWMLTVEKVIAMDLEGETTEQVDLQTTRYEWLP